MTLIIQHGYPQPHPHSRAGLSRIRQMPCVSRPLRLTAVLVTTLAIGGCAAEAVGDRQPADAAGFNPGQQSGAGPAGQVPPGFERFYRQGLTWGGCQEFATTDRTEESFAD